MPSSSIDLNKIFFKTETYDPSTNYPVYIFDSTALPNPNSCNFQSLIALLAQKIPDSRYVLVFFTAGLSNDPQFSINHKCRHAVDSGNNDVDSQASTNNSSTFSWVWGVKAFKLIPKEKRKYLRKIYIVHESWWIRALTEVLKNLISSKFMNSKQKKVLHINNLSELSKHLDITKLNISLANYYYEFHNNSENKTMSKKSTNDATTDNNKDDNTPNKIIIPIHLPDIFGVPFYENQLSWYYYNLIFFKINQMFYSKMSENIKHLILFHNNNANIIFQSDLIKDAVSRNQVLTLDEFDIYPLINIWKYFLKSLHGCDSLLPVDLILRNKALVEHENLSSTNKLLIEILKFNNLEIILNDLMNFFLIPIIHTDIKILNDSNSYIYKLSKFLIKFLCGIDIGKIASNHDKKLISIFIKNLIIHWPFLDSNNLKIQKNVPTPPPSRKKTSISTTKQPQQVNPTFQNLELYMTTNNLISENERLLNDDGFLISRLQDAKHLNNFNILSNAHQFQFTTSSLSPTSHSFSSSLYSDIEDNNNNKFSSFKNNFKNLLSNNTNINRTNNTTSLIDDVISVSSDEITNNNSHSTANSSQIVTKKKLPKLPPRSVMVGIGQQQSLLQKQVPPQLPERHVVAALTQSEENLILSNSDPYGSISEYNNNESTSSLGMENLTLNSNNIHSRYVNHNNGNFYNNSSSTLSSSSNSSAISLNNAGSAATNTTNTTNVSINSSSLSSNIKSALPPPIPIKTKPKFLIKKKTLEGQKFILKDKKKYAGIEGGKVVKLAQLFEERLESIQILDGIQDTE